MMVFHPPSPATILRRRVVPDPSDDPTATGRGGLDAADLREAGRPAGDVLVQRVRQQGQLDVR
jgi:hypothetical protein